MMGKLCVAGRHVGSTDGDKDYNLPGCYSSPQKRRLLGCDGAKFRARTVAFDAENPDGKEVDAEEVTAEVDSAFASKVIAVLATKLDTDEMGRVLNILKEADLISDEEMQAVNGALDPRPEETSETAMDARFPNQNRLHRNNGRIDPAAQAAFDAKFGCGHIKGDPYPSLPPGHGDNPNPREGHEEWLARTFPNANRLKR